MTSVEKPDILDNIAFIPPDTSSTSDVTEEDTYFIDKIEVTEDDGQLFNQSGKSKLVLTNNCKFIGECAFKHCEALKSITIPESVTYIRGDAF